MPRIAKNKPAKRARAAAPAKRKAAPTKRAKPKR